MEIDLENKPLGILSKGQISRLQIEYYTFLKMTKKQISFSKWYTLIKEDSKGINMILRNGKEIKNPERSNPKIIVSRQDEKRRRRAGVRSVLEALVPRSAWRRRIRALRQRRATRAGRRHLPHHRPQRPRRRSGARRAYCAGLSADGRRNHAIDAVVVPPRLANTRIHRNAAGRPRVAARPALIALRR